MWMRARSIVLREWGRCKTEAVSICQKKKIFGPAKLNNIVLKNRLIRSATWEGMADIDGHIPDKLYDTYEELAKGGIGAIITGFTSVDGDDHYFGGMVRLSDDELIPEHKRLTDLCHKENCPVIVQIALGEYANGTEMVFS